MQPCSVSTKATYERNVNLAVASGAVVRQKSPPFQPDHKSVAEIFPILSLKTESLGGGAVRDSPRHIGFCVLTRLVKYRHE